MPALKNKYSDNPLHDEFFENFMSKHTRESYRRDLVLFYEYCAHHFKKGPLQIEREHVIKYRNTLSECGGQRDEGHAPKTIARKLAAISSYYDYLVEKGLCSTNPATSVKRPRLDVKSPTQILSSEQVRGLFNLIDASKLSGSMHKALLLLFFTSGLRKSEVIHLRYKDLRLINDQWIVEFTGKGGKIGQKLLHQEAIEALESYFQLMKEHDRAHQPDDWLFQPSTNPSDQKNLNKSLNPRTINEILEYYAKKLGLNIRVSPHSARATFISELLEIGIDIYSVAREVHHSSVKTTQEYDKRRKRLIDSPVTKLRY
jgi:integrase/recombinase XerD